MRLHRLTLTDFKGVERREIAFPASGVLVVEGRNEVGKTSMIEALDLLFDHKDSSRRADIRAAQPVGQDVGPRVEVEMSTGSYHFTYLKQWVKQPRTELHVSTPHREDLTGEAAHQRARAILAETVDLPLWRALRLMQAMPLVQTDLLSSSSLSAALDAAAGSAHDAGAAGESLLAAAEEHYVRYFTGSRGQPTGEYKSAIERVSVARDGVALAEAALDDVAHDVDLHDRLTTDRAAAVARRDEARVRRAAVDSESEAVTSLAAAAREAVRLRDQSRRDLDRALERRDERAALADSVDAKSLALGTHSDAVAELREQIQPREGEIAAARIASDQAELAESLARADYDLAAAAATRRRDEAELATIEQRLERIDAAMSRRGQADAALARATVTASAWSDIEAAARDVDLAAAALAAGSASVVVESLSGEQIVEVDGEQVAVRPAATLTQAVTAAVELVVPGQLRFVVRPEADAAERAKSVESAERHLRRLLEPVGASSVAAARELHEQRRVARAEHTRAQEWLQDLLDGDERSALLDRRDVLRAVCAVANAEPAGDVAAVATPDETVAAAAAQPEALRRVRRGSTAASHASPGRSAVPVSDDALPFDVSVRPDETDSQGDGEPSGPVGGDPRANPERERLDAAGGLADNDPRTEVAPVLDVEQARHAAEAARDEVARCATRVEAVRSQLEVQRLELARAESLVAAVREELQGQRARLQAVREAAADDEISDEVASATTTFESAEAAAAQRTAELGHHDVESLRLELQALDAELVSLETARRDLDDELIRVEARLEQSGRQGRAESYDVARTELERATRAHEALRRHAEAARLLHTTLQQQNQVAKASYARPFTDAVARLGRLVYGASFEIEVDERLAVVARVLDGRRIPYAALSTGAKEQLAIITRLACATLVDGDSGVPVIIDDALGHSDPDRLRRVCAVFGRVDADAQVVLLTCSPGRYAAIGEATVVRL